MTNANYEHQILASSFGFLSSFVIRHYGFAATQPRGPINEASSIPPRRHAAFLGLAIGADRPGRDHGAADRKPARYQGAVGFFRRRFPAVVDFLLAADAG